MRLPKTFVEAYFSRPIASTGYRASAFSKIALIRKLLAGGVPLLRTREEENLT